MTDNIPIGHSIFSRSTNQTLSKALERNIQLDGLGLGCRQGDGQLLFPICGMARNGFEPLNKSVGARVWLLANDFNLEIVIGLLGFVDK